MEAESLKQLTIQSMTHPLLNMVEARLRHGHFAAPSGTASLLLTEDLIYYSGYTCYSNG